MHMDKLKNMLCDKLAEYENKGITSSSDLNTIHILTDTIKNIAKIEMYDEYDEGNSRRSYGSYRGSYAYDDGASYRRRDSMGRYTRDYRDDGMSNRYARDEANKELAMHLSDLMHIASTEKERTALSEALEAIKRG